MTFYLGSFLFLIFHGLYVNSYCNCSEQEIAFALCTTKDFNLADFLVFQ